MGFQQGEMVSVKGLGFCQMDVYCGDLGWLGKVEIIKMRQSGLKLFVAFCVCFVSCESCCV